MLLDPREEVYTESGSREQAITQGEGGKAGGGGSKIEDRNEAE